MKCKACSKRLDATTLCEKNDEVYCNACYSRNFGPKGVGFGLGGSMTSTEATTSTPPVKSEAPPVVKSDPPPTLGAKFCPNCGNPCSGMKFCSTCGTKLI
uniref:Zinc-ribbon domain-containing protein n=1 Tax=Arcella intermedia TaxID=1963864 RepID=A0A6B2LQ45_9EUKA